MSGTIAHWMWRLGLGTKRACLVTTLLILEEFLTDLSRRDPEMKQRAAAFVQRILDDPLTDVVELDLSVFKTGLDLYGRRLDKSYSMVDCVSMTICRDRSITQVLTADRDFEREGLVAMLRSDS